MPQIHNNSKLTAGLSRALGLMCFPLLTLALNTAQADTRELFDSNSPTWLRAVGKLQVPGVKFSRGQPHNHRENCSATLVVNSIAGRENGRKADTIITAWHCLEYYKDLSKTITFTLLYGTPDSFTTEAYRLSDGGGMSADWAVLRLIDAVPVTRVAALPIHPGRANPAKLITMAGYSTDEANGRLSYDPSCSITAQATHRGMSATNCSALKGASGGAVVQLSDQGSPMLAGVISQGNSHDLSLFVPVRDFRPAIKNGLR